MFEFLSFGLCLDFVEFVELFKLYWGFAILLLRLLSVWDVVFEFLNFGVVQCCCLFCFVFLFSSFCMLECLNCWVCELSVVLSC